MQRFILAFTSAILCLGLLLDDASAGVKEIIAKADGYYAKRGESGQIDKAIKAYQKVLVLDPSNVKAYYMIAKCYYWVGTHTQDRSKRLKIFKEGIEWGKRCKQVDPKEPNCRFWLAVSYGKYGETKGIMQSLTLIDPMKAELKLTMKTPEMDEGGPDRVMGRLLFKIPGFKGGDKNKAIEHLKKSLTYAPNNLLTHVFLAEIYIDLGKKAEAKKELDFVIKAPNKKPEDPDDKKRAQELLKEL